MSLHPDDVGACWCGEEEPLYSDELPDECGGAGVLYCYCGADFCICHWHGEVECDGCDQCREDDGLGDDYDDTWRDE